MYKRQEYLLSTKYRPRHWGSDSKQNILNCVNLMELTFCWEKWTINKTNIVSKMLIEVSGQEENESENEK